MYERIQILRGQKKCRRIQNAQLFFQKKDGIKMAPKRRKSSEKSFPVIFRGYSKKKSFFFFQNQKCYIFENLGVFQNSDHVEFK